MNMVEQSLAHVAPVHYYPLQELEQLAAAFLSEGQGAEIKIETFQHQLEEQSGNLQQFIETQALALGREKEIRQLIQRYHASLVRLLDKLVDKWDAKNRKTANDEHCFESYVDNVEGIIDYIDNYFHEHHSAKQCVPIVMLCRQKKELAKRIATIEKTILVHPEEMVAGLLLKRLRLFTAPSRPVKFRVRYRDIRYKKELLRHLEEIKWDNNPDALFTSIEQILVYLNYNSKSFVRLLLRKMKNKVDRLKSIKEQVDMLLLYQKNFRQIHPKPRLILNPGYHSLSKLINDWFAEEIRYLKEKLKWSTMPSLLTDSNSTEKKHDKVLQKVLVKLSSDQTGLILRAADDLRILVARSLSEVFKTIVPHLSTSNKTDPSYKGMRTQSYVAEERDKEIAIEALERIIKKIREY